MPPYVCNSFSWTMPSLCFYKTIRRPGTAVAENWSARNWNCIEVYQTKKNYKNLFVFPVPPGMPDNMLRIPGFFIPGSFTMKKWWRTTQSTMVQRILRTDKLFTYWFCLLLRREKHRHRIKHSSVAATDSHKAHKDFSWYLCFPFVFYCPIHPSGQVCLPTQWH